MKIGLQGLPENEVATIDKTLMMPFR